ncbi:MAG: ion transporter [Cyclobacteriaceae bacterium]|nr:ion transporter [Cyclobacteriaceae bacterium]
MKIRNRLRKIVEENDTRKGRFFDNAIQFLILISLVSFSLETLPDNSDEFNVILKYVEVVSVILFSIEYILRIYVSQKPFKYIFSFYGLIDLIAILPFYLAHGLDLRFLRIFRIFRVFRSFKLIRYNKAMRRFHLAANIVKEELVLFLMVAAIFVFIAASGIYFFENEAQPEKFSSVFHSLWWAIVTLTTVGYGDVYPITVGGMVFTFFVLLVGVGIVAVPAGLIASALSKAREMEEKEKSL